MLAYREIIDAKRLLSVMQIPHTSLSEKFEVIVIPVKSRSKSEVERKSAMGFLKNYANPALAEHEKSAWELHSNC